MRTLRVYTKIILLLLITTTGVCQTVDTLPVLDSTPITITHAEPLQEILDANRVVDFSTTPQFFPEEERVINNSEFSFYFLIILFIYFGVLRVTFPKYFTNLFRVFFNTSLRQSQITDQLLQAKLPSLGFNILFTLTAGFYFYLLFKHHGKVDYYEQPMLVAILIGGVAVMYVVKYLVIRFAGWVSGNLKEADTYVFIVFLVNKIMGVVLLLLLPMLTFSSHPLSLIGFTVSYTVIILLFFLRFIRSFQNVNAQLQISRFHFLLYIVGLEILPLFLVYKGVMLYIGGFL